ncbi:amino acid tansporter, putative [Trypanosoma cruzi]|nr:amino acid tansporter, putative [Trypanosoma cruzi]
MSALQPLALLVPRQIQSLVVDSGAEIVVERRPDEKRCLFLRFFDEAEREEAVRGKSTCAHIHEQVLKDLKWARSTLWNDRRLQQYLYSRDWMTWPSLPELSSMVELVRSAKETDEVPDFSGSNALKKALGIIYMEMTYPGLHALKEENLAGTLLAFGTTRRDNRIVGDTMHTLLGRGDEQRIGSSLWVLDLKTPSFTPDEAILLSLTARVREKCLRVMQPELGVAECGGSWSAVLAAQRRGTDELGPRLFCGISEGLLQFAMAPVHLAKAMCEAAERGFRVRLRVGIYLTVLQRTEVLVMTRGSCQSVATDDKLEVKAAFVERTGRSYDACAAAGLFLYLLEGETLEVAIRLRFLGPLAGKFDIMETMPLTATTQLTPVLVRHNPFAIVHGPRVVGTFPENCEVRKALSDLLLSRDPSVLPATPEPSQQSMAMKTNYTSATLTGEQLRRGVDDAIFRTLSQAPMTRAALSAHDNMARFRGLANFEAILKDSLKRNAMHQGKKYYLKE